MTTIDPRRNTCLLPEKWRPARCAPNLGWASYGDSQYTPAAPRLIVGGASEKMTINGLAVGSTDLTQMPVGTEHMWDTANNWYAPNVAGSAVVVRVSFTGRLLVAAGAYVDLEALTNPDGTVIWANVIAFPKGSGVDHTFSFTVNVFVGPYIFSQNGVEVFIAPSHNTQFHTFSTMITRVYAPEYPV